MGPLGGVFRQWYNTFGVLPLVSDIKTILDFLQDGLEKDLKTSTLTRQVAALQRTLGAAVELKLSSVLASGCLTWPILPSSGG